MWATKTRVVCLLCGLIAVSTDAVAQPRSASAFTVSGEKTCEAITWQPSALERYPEIGSACQSVETYDGRDFVRFDGTVRSVSQGGSQLTMRFKGTEQDVTLETMPDMRVRIAGQSVRVRDLARGQELTFHVPSDRFVANFFEPEAPTEVAQAEFVVATIQLAQADTQPPRRELPRTAGLLPLVGLAGAGLLGFGAILLQVCAFLRRRGSTGPVR